MKDYLSINRAAWNQRTKSHIQSPWYQIDDFLAGQTSLKPIELGLLGDISGQSAVHLQCHFGMDTLSLARMGAKVTGLDLSDEAIRQAKQLATKTRIEARFVRGDVYCAPDLLLQTYDIVFTTYGTIGWLPDIDRWAAVVHHLLQPGGRLVFVEFHPVVWMFANDFKNIQYSYFQRGAIEENEEGTYAAQDGQIYQSVSWNHGLAEVMGALLRQGLSITHFEEYPYSPYACFSGTEEYEPGKFRIRHLADKIPMVYSMVAQKEN